MAQRLGRQAVTALGRGPARPGPYPPQPTPRLARAYGSQSADPQWTGRGPTLQGPIPGPPLVSGPLQNKVSEAAVGERDSPETEGTWQRSPCGLCAPPCSRVFWDGAQWSLLLITPPCPPAPRPPCPPAPRPPVPLRHVASRALVGPHIAMATVAGPSTQSFLPPLDRGTVPPMCSGPGMGPGRKGAVVEGAGEEGRRWSQVCQGMSLPYTPITTAPCCVHRCPDAN
ncbi:unnamed protein product [Boreogadus saida]